MNAKLVKFGKRKVEVRLELVDPTQIEIYEHRQDPKKVASYQKKLQKLPPIVVTRYPNGEMKMLDGHHRSMAAILSGKMIKAFIISSEDYEILRESMDYEDFFIAETIHESLG